MNKLEHVHVSSKGIPPSQPPYLRRDPPASHTDMYKPVHLGPPLALSPMYAMKVNFGHLGPPLALPPMYTMKINFVHLGVPLELLNVFRWESLH